MPKCGPMDQVIEGDKGNRGTWGERTGRKRRSANSQKGGKSRNG